MSCERIIPEKLRKEIKREGSSLESLLREDRLMLFLDFMYRVRALPVRPLLGLLEKLHILDQELPDGRIHALENFLGKLKIKCEIDCSKEQAELLKRGPWIIYGDHPGQMEAFALILAVMKLSGREDEVKGMGVEYLIWLGPNIVAMVEPVYSERNKL